MTEIVRIYKVIKENKDIKTIIFPYAKNSKPGQFFMVLIPGIDEIPMSVSYISRDYQGFTFKKVGEATTELFNKKVGEILGIRGPLGNGFAITGKRILFVGGGTGIAAIAPAVELARAEGREAFVVVGSKSREELFFVERLKLSGAKLNIATDDGSIGYHGLASDLAEEIMEKEKFDLVITCGPEQMMKKVVDFCNSRGIEVQASLERYIKCGIGICGQCCIDGLRVCKDGPVFNGRALLESKEFGVFKRDAAGRKVYIR